MAFHVPEESRLAFGPPAPSPAGALFGAFLVSFRGRRMYCVASNGDPPVEGDVVWEHVSVSLQRGKRCPSWPEMCYVKSLFWDAEDCVVQYHPPAAVYVNDHDGVLHLWRPPQLAFPMPPIEYV